MKTKDNITTVGENIRSDNARWQFGDNVPKNFSAHVRRSVPYYDDGHDLVLKLSDYFIKDDSTAYELGFSTGTLISALAKRHKPSVNWIGLDVEDAMVEQAKAESKPPANVSLQCEDISAVAFEPNDFTVSYYTMQFVHPKHRQNVIDNIYQSLNWGGAFLMFEKVRGPDARFQDILSNLYNDYKLEQGYSPEEIMAKSRSLKGVLEPFSEQGNLDLLKRAGFVDVVCVFRYLCFAGFLAIK